MFERSEMKFNDKELMSKNGYREVRLGFQNRFGVQNKDGKWGFVDENGKEVVPCQYDTIEYFENGVCSVQRDGKWGYVDLKGKEVIACEFDNILDDAFPKKPAVAYKDGKMYMLTKLGAFYSKIKLGKDKNAEADEENSI